MYTDNRNQQILIALLKEHGIRKVIASPGGTHPALLMSMQTDGFFEMYSCVDERSAAYMACGLAEESGEPVVICCTGATASRNYMPALTEAYYRKIPLVVITCSRPNQYVGHLMPQVTNRNVYPADVLVDGEHLPVVRKEEDRWDCEYKVNKALLALKHRGGGPVHLNVESISSLCTTPSLPAVHAIHRITQNDAFPELVGKRVGIFLGSHRKMSASLQHLIDLFCEKHNAVVFADHTSGYGGQYSIPYALIATQMEHDFGLSKMDLLIHLGEPSGDYLTMESLSADHVWRLSEDGEVRIRFNTLDYVFDMPDEVFFDYYASLQNEEKNIRYWEECHQVYTTLYQQITDLPLSLIYIAYVLSPRMPKECSVHFSIVNALRSWNFFTLDRSIRTNCNVGAFGIDGCSSSLIGASLADPNRLYFLFTGDLAFFYDMNVLGNRHVGSNVRILLLNDGKGAEFTHFKWPAYEGNRDLFITGAGHFGQQSKTLVRDYATNLGFEYMQADSKESFLAQYERFVTQEKTDKPMLFEVITSDQGQSDAWETLCHLAAATPVERLKNKLHQYEHQIVDPVLRTVVRKLQQ